MTKQEPGPKDKSCLYCQPTLGLCYAYNLVSKNKQLLFLRPSLLELYNYLAKQSNLYCLQECNNSKYVINRLLCILAIL
jgi:hypothetical protein